VPGPLIFVAVFAASYLLTRAMLAYCRRVQMIDIPNERSSHTSPTPRGGGVAIALSSLGAILIGVTVRQVSYSLGLAMLAAGVFVAGAGFWDDHRSLHPGTRLAGQLASACLIVWALGTPQSLGLGFVRIPSLGLTALSVLAVVWLINLTNFMDGIDGLAAAECVFVMFARGMLLYFSGDHTLLYPCFALAAAAMGFLLLNWAPAKIFMGDAGSCYLGAAYGALLLADTVHEPLHLWVWLILLSAFLADSTVTLLRRLTAGERVWKSHSTHAYQHLGRACGHGRTTRVYLAVNLLWLGPLALCSSLRPQAGPIYFLVAIGPLVLGVWRLGAGRETIRPPFPFASKTDLREARNALS